MAARSPDAEGRRPDSTRSPMPSARRRPAQNGWSPANGRITDATVGYVEMMYQLAALG